MSDTTDEARERIKRFPTDPAEERRMLLNALVQVDRLRERVAELEGGIEKHRDDCEEAESRAEFPGDTEGDYRFYSVRLWSLLNTPQAPRDEQEG